MPTPSPDDSRERIIAAAAVLFADHGYDGASTRQLAAAAGLNVATVAYHVGTKADLYREVMRRAHVAEAEALDVATAVFRGGAATDPARAVGGLVDAYLDFCLAHPHIPALWMRRWLSDAAGFAELEAEYARPLIDAVGTAVAEALPGLAARDGGQRHGASEVVSAVDVDVEMTVWTVLWATHGFCRSGILDARGVRRGPGDDAAVARFRAHLRRLVLRELGLTPL